MASSQMSSFNAAKDQALARWQALAPRERTLLTVMAWAVGLTLLIMLGVRPAVRTLQQTPVQLREVNAQLDEMRRQANESQTLRQMPPVPPAQAQAALQSATDRLGAGTARLNVMGDRATVVFTKVSGSRLAEWLQDVRSSARSRPAEANLIQISPGVYSGSVTLALTTPGGMNR